MDEIIPINWYIETPIDFEYKQYILLGYLQKVDNSFLKRVLSPHLLHMEKMVEDMKLFRQLMEDIRKDFDKERYYYIKENPKLLGEDDPYVMGVKEIVEFSIPQIQVRIDCGYKIFEKNKQVLY